MVLSDKITHGISGENGFELQKIPCIYQGRKLMIMDAQIQIYPWLKEVLEYALLINKDDFKKKINVSKYCKIMIMY